MDNCFGFCTSKLDTGFVLNLVSFFSFLPDLYGYGATNNLSNWYNHLTVYSKISHINKHKESKGTKDIFALFSGCVEVVGCLKSEELVSWEDVPESVRILFTLLFLCHLLVTCKIILCLKKNTRLYNAVLS